MPALVIAETYSDGQVLFEADLDNIKSSLEDFFNLTKVDSANLQSSVLNKLVPVGTVVMYGASTPPAGWLNCDGSEVSRFTYAVLFGIVGTTFGSGDGINTFNLPDFQRQIPIGRGGSSVSGPGTTVGNQGGSETHTLTTPEIPAHTHASGGSHTHTEGWTEDLGSGATGVCVGGHNGAGSIVSLNLSTTAGISTLDNAGGGGAHNNVQPSLVVNFIIKT